MVVILEYSNVPSNHAGDSEPACGTGSRSAGAVGPWGSLPPLPALPDLHEPLCGPSLLRSAAHQPQNQRGQLVPNPLLLSVTLVIILIEIYLPFYIEEV